MKDDLNEVKVINSKLSSGRSTEKLLEVKKTFEQITLEDFIKAVEEAEKIIPERPAIVVKNAKVTGVRLNSKIINSIPQSKESISFYKGIKVYQDDSVKSPQFIVEGEIEPKKKILKWEDLEFTYDEQKIKVKLNGENYTVVYFISPAYYGHNGYEYVGILKDDDIVVYSINGYLYTANLLKQFFNNLHLERVE